MRDRIRRVGKVAAFVLLQALIVAGLLWVLNQVGDGADERAQQATEIAALQAGLDEANARLEAQGQPPVPVPEVEPGAAPTVIQIMPTQDQLDDTVAAYCAARDDCTGEPGTSGESPAPLTEAELMAAVQACYAAGACPVPADGIDGRDGIDGTNGTNGIDAPPITQDQVNAAFAAYCDANNGCRGADGAPGTTCADGTPGTFGEVLMRTDEDSMPHWTPAVLCIPTEEG